MTASDREKMSEVGRSTRVMQNGPKLTNISQQVEGSLEAHRLPPTTRSQEGRKPSETPLAKAARLSLCSMQGGLAASGLSANHLSKHARPHRWIAVQMLSTGERLV